MDFHKKLEINSLSHTHIYITTELKREYFTENKCKKSNARDFFMKIYQISKQEILKFEILFFEVILMEL